MRRFEHAVRLWTVVLEISVLMAQFPSKEIAQLSYEFRTMGLGYANIGALLMASGLSYDSAAGRALAGKWGWDVVENEWERLRRLHQGAANGAEAMWNYKMVTYDGSSGVHNSSYAKAMLEAALETMRAYTP